MRSTSSTLLARTALGESDLAKFGIVPPCRSSYHGDFGDGRSVLRTISQLLYPFEPWYEDEDVKTLEGKSKESYHCNNLHAGRSIPHTVLHGIEVKSCSTCCRLKPVTNFYCNSCNSDGLSSQCKECRRKFKHTRP